MPTQGIDLEAQEASEANSPPSQINAATLANIFLPQRRDVNSWSLLLFYLFFYGGILLILLISYGMGVDWPGAFSSVVNSNLIPLTVFMYGYEPIKAVTSMLITPAYSENKPSPVLVSHESNRFDLNKELAIIIPCHHSAKTIESTIASCLKHVKPNQIFIMDNAKSKTPPDNTAEVIQKKCPGVNYFFIPNIGNKTIALFYGAQLAKPQFPYCLIIDDDVHLPDGFTFKKECFDDPTVKGLVYPLRAISEYPSDTVLTRLLKDWQDIEYQFADLEMRRLDQFGSVVRPHGAGSLWNTQAMLSVLLKHNTIFHGEDVMMGHILQRMHQGGQSILRMDSSHYLSTYVPVTYFGPAEKGNLWFQRVRSWSVAPFTHFWELCLKPFMTVWYRPGKSVASLLVIKENQLYNLYTQALHVLRVPFLFFSRNNPRYWWAVVAATGLQSVIALVFNYMKLPPHLRNKLLPTISYPFYKLVDGFMGTAAFCRAMWIEIPTAKPYTTIEQLLKQHALPELDEVISNVVSPKGVTEEKTNALLAKAQSVEVHELYAVLVQNEVLLAHLISRCGVFQPEVYFSHDLQRVYRQCLAVVLADSSAPHLLEERGTVYKIKHSFFATSINEVLNSEAVQRSCQLK